MVFYELQCVAFGNVEYVHKRVKQANRYQRYIKAASGYDVTGYKVCHFQVLPTIMKPEELLLTFREKERISYLWR